MFIFSQVFFLNTRNLVEYTLNEELAMVMKIKARWDLEITIIEIQWDLRQVIWEFLLMTSIIGDKRLGCSIPIQHWVDLH